MKFRICLIVGWVLVASAAARAELKLPGLFSDHAVLQAGREIPIWGWADAGANVDVRIGSTSAKSQAAADGKWIVRLPAMTASGTPVEITVKADKETKTIGDVLIGEVWLGSGQSNMTFAMNKTDDAAEAMAAANVPMIRLFTVPRSPATQPSVNVGGKWEVCSPKSVGSFSAVMYHFGRNINERLKVPVGLVHSSWGGTPLQAWMPRELFADDEQIAQQSKRIMATMKPSTVPATDPVARYPHLQPTNLFNGMIAPVVPYAMRGVLWYQGEANVHQEGINDYSAMMTAMVGRWRELWGEGDWPFLFVQIAPYGKYGAHADQLPAMWEQQVKSLKSIPNSDMAANSDLGNPADIHPKNKREVGRRLALIALAKTYKASEAVCDAPMFESASREEKKIRVHFSGVGTGLISRDGTSLDFFEIAGADGEFVPATAAIEGTDVVVESDKVAEPTAVRFGWNATAAPNLMNKDGLPAVAFRVEVK